MPPDDTAPPPLRRHQAEALAALEEAWAAGRSRAWVVLPPGVGKTRLGLEAVRRHRGRAIVFGPNTAIQTQWESTAHELGIEAGADRTLDHQLTSLTYQALAVFDPDAEVDDEGDLEPGNREPGNGEPGLLARLHPNGQALVETLRAAGPILLVLDECHHLLEVWGRLLAELLAELPQARVLGLTATPPGVLTEDQAVLVQGLFGDTLYEATIPAAVREGELAPFAEAAWLTVPTSQERAWLRGQAERFTELTTQLTDPHFGTTNFLNWLDQRFVGAEVGWSTLLRREPRLCAAALRMHHHGLLALPSGAGLGEEHRHEPDADDWMVLLEDWIAKHLLKTGSTVDEQVVAAIRRVLPSVGYVWTRAGIRPGRTPVDRVLARSAAKATAAVQIVRSEHAGLGPRMRTLLLCDHERAGPTMSADLAGVLDPQSGAARTLLAELVSAPDLVDLRPLLVTGRTLAGTREALLALREFVAAEDPQCAAELVIHDAADGAATLEGAWTSRTWLPWVTRFFESGSCRVLVGTRGLLGEGWDARWVTGLVDLTAATTTTAVVQARGRALRLDPAWPEKVAINWSVVCVSDEHPKGGADWNRLVRKHRGFLGVDHTGEVIDGVAHIDPGFSPYAPPASDTFDAVNARMLARAEDRPRIRELWRIGRPYGDTLRRAAWIRPGVATRLGAGAEIPAVVVSDRRLDVRSGDAVRPDGGASSRTAEVLGAGVLAAGVLAGGLVALVGDRPELALLVLLVGLVVGGGLLVGSRIRTGRELLASAAEPPGIVRIARAVADALQGADVVPGGADAVEVDIDADGTYRCWLAGVDEHQSEVFATAVDEAVRPIGGSRYVLPRWVVGGPPYGPVRALLAASRRVRPEGVVWHPVPSVLGVRRERADQYAAAWRRWVGGGEPVYTGSPEGAGILASQQGSDPFRVTTVMRRHWH